MDTLGGIAINATRRAEKLITGNNCKTLHDALPI